MSLFINFNRCFAAGFFNLVPNDCIKVTVACLLCLQAGYCCIQGDEPSAEGPLLRPPQDGPGLCAPQSLQGEAFITSLLCRYIRIVTFFQYPDLDSAVDTVKNNTY